MLPRPVADVLPRPVAIDVDTVAFEPSVHLPRGICLAGRREAFEAKEAAEAYFPYAAQGRRRHRKPQQAR